MLKGKKIILGITGSIAAYKAAYLVRLLVKEGAEVKVVMTPYAKEFITPLTLSALSGHPVANDMFDRQTGEWTSHVDLGLWADLFLIAPATANTIAKLAHGHADNLLCTIYLSARCPVMIAPAMDLDMFNHPATQKNIQVLEDRGHILLDTGTGELASGLTGKGRLEEPETIVKELAKFFKKKSPKTPLKGKKILVSAGPTHESLDAVRYIGNHSSGKMGLAIVNALIENGAEVHLVLGPVHEVPAENELLTLYRVTSADEMYHTCMKLFPEMNGAIMAAAVGDFTPEQTKPGKVKRGKDDWTLRLKPTQDIAAGLGRQKKPGQWLVGFALETSQPEVHAMEKLRKKNLDLAVLNSLKDKGAGFGYDTNKISLIYPDGKIKRFLLKPKAEVARDIIANLPVG